jgi:hypothetical protein
MTGIVRIGDYVSWRGDFGTAAPRRARVVGLERMTDPGDKYGDDVSEVPWDVPFVADLDNGHWARSSQLAPDDA